jgi:hypothetical protein
MPEPGSFLKIKFKPMAAKKLLLLFCISLFAVQVEAQTDYESFYLKSQKNLNTGMYVLGSWALLNIATGAYGLSTQTGSSKYFHQMNLFWNSVNLGIAGYSLISNYLSNISLLSHQQMMDKHLFTEKLLLINAGLDVLYMASGAFMASKSKSSTKRPELLKGYGQSLLLQGGFLLVFDLVLYGIQHNHSSIFFQNVQLSFNPQSFLLVIWF